MDKTTIWIIRGAAGAFILFVLSSLINTGESTKKFINKTPNSCPLGFAYAGTGYCRKVACVYRSGRNNPDLGGKDYACGNADFWVSGAIGRLPLEWGSETIQATYDSNCPNKSPSIGWRSSCTEARGEPSNPHVVGGVRRK
tara:strand:+ start:55 stop:477 length:423 start_codon:yes stop_codon:yes gene_type:complete